MKPSILLLYMFMAAISAQHCHKEYDVICKNTRGIEKCNARFGNIKSVERLLKEFTKAQINDSYFYLLLSAHFGNYKYNRKGFQKLFSEMSDKAWEDSIKLVKHMSKRGVHMDNFKLTFTETTTYPELEALATSADKLIKMANHANNIIQHKITLTENKQNPLMNNSSKAFVIKNEQDPEIIQFVEENFLEQYADKIRQMVGYNADLSRLLQNKDTKALGIEIFDLHLQK